MPIINPHGFQEPQPVQSPFPAGSLVRLALAELLERFAYYGLRSIVFLYILHEFNLTDGEPALYHSMFISLTALLTIPAGILGDRWISKNLVMLIGLLICALGCFVLLIPAKLALISGILLVATGSGLFKPNMLSGLSAAFQNKRRYLDGAYSILYAVINIGALLGGFLFSLLYDPLTESHFQLGFLAAGFLYILALLVIFFEYKSLNTNVKIQSAENKSLSPVAIISLISALLFIPAFWVINGVLNDQLANCDIDEANKLFNILALLTAVLAGPILGILWFFTRIGSLIKTGVGFLVLAIMLAAFTIVSPCFMPISYGMPLTEVLIAVSGYSIIARFAPMKFQGLFFGIMTSSFYFASKMTDGLRNTRLEIETIYLFALGLSILGGLIFILLGIFLPKNERV